MGCYSDSECAKNGIYVLNGLSYKGELEAEFREPAGGSRVYLFLIPVGDNHIPSYRVAHRYLNEWSLTDSFFCRELAIFEATSKPEHVDTSALKASLHKEEERLSIIIGDYMKSFILKKLSNNKEAYHGRHCIRTLPAKSSWPDHEDGKHWLDDF